MTELPRLGVQKARETFRAVVDDALEKGQITIVERHGRSVAVIAPYEWFERATAALASEAKEPECATPEPTPRPSSTASTT